MNETLDDDLRCWIYSHLGALFADLPPALDPPEAPAGRKHAATTRAVEALRAALRSASADDVAAEQVRLFVNAGGGVAAPPYASWYLDRMLCGPSAAAAAAAYAAQGLEVAADAGQPPDFIGAELDFLHFLCRHQIAARATGDAAGRAAAAEAESSFITTHLARWAPRFAAAIRSADPGPVFAKAADLLEAFAQAHTAPASGRR